MENVKLIVVGKKKNLSIYKRLIECSNTIYYEPMTKDKLINIYRTADIFALVSEGETFGLVYAEALSQGLPIIYTKGEGFDGQIKDDFVGVSVNPKREEIIFAINKIFENYYNYSKNTTSVIEKFRWNTIVKKYNDIYHEITRK